MIPCSCAILNPTVEHFGAVRTAAIIVPLTLALILWWTDRRRRRFSRVQLDEDRAVPPWTWRKASGGRPARTDALYGQPPERLFHAYDLNNNAACEPSLGLVRSCEEPNEWSHLCPECIIVVKATPWGREKRFADEDGATRTIGSFRRTSRRPHHLRERSGSGRP